MNEVIIMVWEDILKRSYSTTNLPMLKEGVEKVYATIPTDTIFESADMFPKFVEMVKPNIGKKNTDIRAWNTFVRRKGKDWFPSYFTKYGLSRKYIEQIGHRSKYKNRRI